MPHYSRNSLIGLWHAFTYALKGCVGLWRNEIAFRHDIALILLTLPPMLWFAKTAWLGLYCISAAIFILFAEAVNSAIEALCDHITTEPHPQIGLIKDMAAFSVMLSVVHYFIVMAWLAYLAIYTRYFV